MSLKLLSFFLISSFIFSACSRPQEETSSITLIAPNKISNKPGQMDAELYPEDREACYAVNITGEGIDLKDKDPNGCSPDIGLKSELYVEPGTPIEINQVPQGKHHIEVYLYLKKFHNEKCPAFTSIFDPKLNVYTYKVGSVDYDLKAEKETITIVVEFPGLSQNIVKQTPTMPASCAKVPSGQNENLRGFAVSSGAQVSSGENMKLYGSIGRPNSAKEAKSSDGKTRIRIK